MPIEEKEKQRIKSYAEKLREIVDKSVNVDNLTDEKAEELKKEKRNVVYHKQGIRFFDDNLQTKIRETLNFLSKNHLHILETGELETLLEQYGVVYKEKKLWIVDAITKIADLNREDIDPESVVYQFVYDIIENDQNDT